MDTLPKHTQLITYADNKVFIQNDINTQSLRPSGKPQGHIALNIQSRNKTNTMSIPTLYVHLLHPLQTIHNTTLHVLTGCTLDTDIQQWHDEINILPLHTHLK